MGKFYRRTGTRPHHAPAGNTMKNTAQEGEGGLGGGGGRDATARPRPPLRNPRSDQNKKGGGWACAFRRKG